MSLSKNKSKILYTPTTNVTDRSSPFGGLVWRSHFVTDTYSDQKILCARVTNFVARIVFYYHQQVYHRDLKSLFRWMVLDFSDEMNPMFRCQQNMPCFQEWLCVVHFFKDFPALECRDSSRLTELLCSFLKIIRFMYGSSTLFLIRTERLSDRQNAMNLLIRTANAFLQLVTYLTTSDVDQISDLVRKLRSKTLGKHDPCVSSRSFQIVIPGDSTYFYHTFQYCKHLNRSICSSCHELHTNHMTHMRGFLTTTHPQRDC